jgi:uncharacterized membrane protein YraQ (UPF0718 family)
MSNLFIATILSYAWSIMPWLVVGSLIAYLVERHFSQKQVRSYFGTMSATKLVAVQLLGMVSPLSIMSQLPVAGSLVRLGAHPGLLLSFFIAERAYDLQSFPIIAGLFGFRFAALNAAAIFTALTVAACMTRTMPVSIKEGMSSRDGSFLLRQAKIAGVVVIGIIVGAALRTFVPADLFGQITGTRLGAIASAVLIGLVLYFGTVLGNYPVAKAFEELGMHSAGVFAFMTVSPVFSLVVIFLFAAAVPMRYVMRQFGIYAVVALLLTLAVSAWV